MQKIELLQRGDIYSCDIGISKDEWLRILQDDRTLEAYRETLLRFYYYPAHRGSCTAVSNMMGGNAASLNSYITRFGEYVQKYLGRFQVVRPDGKSCYWIIPMCEGKDLPKGSEGSFEWQLRPELVEAIREYLIWYLVDSYKKLRKEIPLRGSKYDELYKWELITDCREKDLLYIAKRISKENLIDVIRDRTVINYMLDNQSDVYQHILEGLVDEERELPQRIAEFKQSMKAVVPETYNSKANDERTASAILACVNPWKYTFYKYELYSMFCKYLCISRDSTGLCFQHYLELLQSLSALAKENEELQQILSPALMEMEKSDLLLAQDILWMLFVEIPKRLGFLHQFMFPTRQRVWLWSKEFLKNVESGMLACGSSAKTIKDFRPFKSKEALRKAYQKDVGNTDLKIPDAYWSFVKEVSVGDVVVLFDAKKGDGKQYHKLHGWGIFTSDCQLDENSENPMQRSVAWKEFLEIPIQNKTMSNSIFFQGTNDKQASYIKKLLNIIIEDEMKTNKYQDYIELLKANHNLILTGAPGTGKTYLAKEIAKAMGCSEEQTGFVQFHPSYDYTDFVEGLRPVNDGNGNIGFTRRNGVFKDFCEKALCGNLTHSSDGNRIIILEEGLQQFKDTLKVRKHLEIKSFRSNTFIEVSLNDRNNIAVTHIDSPWSLTDDKMLEYLREKKCHDHDTYTKSIGDYILEHYCNSDSHADTVDISNNNDTPYVFIIDEINRGEISKIFGELFFSIDPGYRGEKGKVNTQYQNMIEEGDVFKSGFYVPENVYIVGTMNDID